MTDKPHDLLDPATLREAVAEVAELADAADVDAVLAGGFALQQYGSPRLTGDIDVVVAEQIPGLDAEDLLVFGGYQSTTPSGVPVDVIVREDQWQKLYEAALANARPHADLALRLVTAPYLAAMKMVAARLQDEQDLEWLIGSGKLDVDETRGLVSKYLGPFAADEFDRTVDLVEWNRHKQEQERARKLARKLLK